MRLTILAVSLAILALSVVGFSPGPDPLEERLVFSPEVTEILALSIRAPSPAGVSCVICDDCGDSGHVTAEAPAGERGGSAHPSLCPDFGEEDPCDLYHPTGCEVTDADLDPALALRTLLQGTIGEIKGLMARSDGSVFVNEERHALQILGCAGSVVASIPVADDQIDVLID